MNAITPCMSTIFMNETRATITLDIDHVYEHFFPSFSWHVVPIVHAAKVSTLDHILWSVPALWCCIFFLIAFWHLLFSLSSPRCSAWDKQGLPSNLAFDCVEWYSAAYCTCCIEEEKELNTTMQTMWLAVHMCIDVAIPELLLEVVEGTEMSYGEEQIGLSWPNRWRWYGEVCRAFALSDCKRSSPGNRGSVTGCSRGRPPFSETM